MRGLLCLSCLIFECVLKNLPHAPFIIRGIWVSIWGIWGIIWGDLGNLGNYLGNLIAQIPNRTAALFKGDKTHVTYQIRNSFFVVTIDNANYKDGVEVSLSERQKQILDYLREDKQTITSLSRALDADRKSIRKDLQKLESLNVIASFGSTKDKYWFCK